VGPRNGARVVARAWSDSTFKQWLLQDATAAIASLGYSGRQGEHMTWSEWVAVLSQTIKAAQGQGDPDLGQTYYQHWLNALERICVEKGIVDREEMDRRTEDWRRAYRCTPHGQPVELSAACRTTPRSD